MKQYTIYIIIFLCWIGQISYGQDLIDRTLAGQELDISNVVPNRLANTIQENKGLGEYAKTNIFQISTSIPNDAYNEVVEDAVILELDQVLLQNLRTERNQNIELQIPVIESKNIALELTQVNIKAAGYRVKTSEGISHFNNDNIFYRGIVKGDPNSLVALSVFQDAIRVVIGDDRGNYIIGKLGDSAEYIIYNERKLKVDLNLDGGCEADGLPISNSSPDISTESRMSNPGDCVSVYVEADYHIYSNQGNSVTNVENYVDAIFNEVIAEFALAGINMEVSEVFVWTSIDPYANISSSCDILSDFKNNTSSFNGNLAHFITSRSMGGCAYRPGLCSSFSYGVSGGLTTNNPASLPLSSSTFVRVAHELGHNMGLNHSHVCVWNGNNTQIDDCGNVFSPPECDGDPCPCFDPNSSTPIIPSSGGGVIMSYCHLSFSVGRNLNNGFTGDAQGDNIMQNLVANATCLDPFCGCTDDFNLTINNSGGAISSGSSPYLANNNIYTNSTDVATGTTVVFRAGNRIEITGTPSNPFEACGNFIAYAGGDICDPATHSLTDENGTALQSSNNQYTIAQLPNDQEQVLAIQIAETTTLSVQFQNTLGEVIQTILTPKSFDVGTYSIDIPTKGLDTGVYTIIIDQDGQQVQQKLTIK